MTTNRFWGASALLFEALSNDEKERVNAELDKCWEEMNPDNCMSKIGRSLVEDERKSRYHREEARAF